MSDDFLDDTPIGGYDEGEQVTLTRLKELADVAERTIRERKWAYSQLFADPGRSAAVAVVIADLARFCRADVSTFRADPREHAALEGRREVWLRIREHIDLPLDELVARYTEGK